MFMEHVRYIITKIYVIIGTTVSNLMLEMRRTNIVFVFTKYLLT